MDLGGLDIRGLAKLLKDVDPERQQNDSDSDLEESAPRPSVKGPGDIASMLQSQKSQSKTPKNAEVGKKDHKGAEKNKIWDSKEAVVVDGAGDSFGNDNISITNDPRQSPNYKMHYRQAVTTEDIFLQMGNKTPATASCEDLVIEIHLPEDDFQKIQLNLKKQAIDLRSPIHFLYLNLPHPIDPRAGNAKWDPEKETLQLTLKLTREFDGVNF